jgi:hypothetical protein
MTTRTLVDTDREVFIHENTYAVLRYDHDTPIQLAKHSLTVGRHASYEAASEVLDRLPDIDRVSASYLHIEERTEMWEEDIACTCGLAEVPIEEHDPGCMLVQAYLIAKGLT